MPKKAKPQDLEKLSSLFGNLMDLENVATSFVEDIVEKKQAKLTKKDIKTISQDLMPDLDKMISKRVKEHLQFLVDTLNKAIKKGE